MSVVYMYMHARHVYTFLLCTSDLSNFLRFPQGPFVQLNELMALLDTSDGSEVIGRSGKRKRDGGEESDDDGSGGAPPINDIYRSRQQKRVHNIV